MAAAASNRRMTKSWNDSQCSLKCIRWPQIMLLVSLSLYHTILCGDINRLRWLVLLSMKWIESEMRFERCVCRLIQTNTNDDDDDNDNTSYIDRMTMTIMHAILCDNTISFTAYLVYLCVRMVGRALVLRKKGRTESIWMRRDFHGDSNQRESERERTKTA